MSPGGSRVAGPKTYEQMSEPSSGIMSSGAV